jgi:hypothetical protein
MLEFKRLSRLVADVLKQGGRNQIAFSVRVHAPLWHAARWLASCQMGLFTASVFEEVLYDAENSPFM